MVDIATFEQDRQAVLADFRKGKFDYIEVASRIREAEFFRHLLNEGDLDELAATYPTPRQKEEVPIWLYLVSQITLRLHGQHAYSTYPYVMHCGGLRDALGPGQVTVEQNDQARRLQCQGYNDKNHYQRATPCDQDFLRKFARDTRAEQLLHWFNHSVPRYLRGFGAFDEEGIFLIDGSYVFVPDNPRYERSSRLRFDEHNHPVGKKDYEALTPAQKERTQWRRCYRAVVLLHMDRAQQTYAFGGLSLMSGKEAEVPEVRKRVESFVSAVGPGVMKLLIFDRGLIDGSTVSWMKTEHGIDSLFPLKKRMLDLEDAKVLAEQDGEPWVQWHPPAPSAPPQPADRPEPVRRRECRRQKTLARRREQRPAGQEPEPVLVKVELKAVSDMNLWGSASVSLQVVLIRDHFSDGSVSQWALGTTKADMGPVDVWQMYRKRTQVEERHRQLKLFWDLAGYRSRSFSLVTAQTVFTLLAYSLIQAFLRKVERGEMNPRTRERILRELRYEDDRLVLYSGNRVTYLTPLEHQEILLTLREGARRRILARTRQLKERQLLRPLPHRPGI